MKRFFTYVDVQLDARGLYTPSHTIVIPKLVGLAEIFDEAKTGISTPNSLLNFGYVEYDASVEADVTTLFTLPNMHGIKEMTPTEAKQMLLDNGYTEVSPDVIEIRAEYVDMDGTTIPATTLDLNS